MNTIIKITPKKPAKSGNTFHLKGELTVANATYIKEEMMAALQKYTLLKLQVDEVSRLDLSVLQLIYAFQRAARSEGKQVELLISLPDEVDQQVRLSGLESMFNLTV